MPLGADYALLGPQVEPPASYWFRCPVLPAVTIADVRKKVDPVLKPYPTAPGDLKGELDDLRARFADRDKPFAPGTLSLFLTDPTYVARPPVGAVESQRAPATPFLKNGGELARLFQMETPGLWHRHVLNVLLDPTVKGGLGAVLSPPRQALIWAALDAAIAGALMAAWHYKWLATKADFTITFPPGTPHTFDSDTPLPGVGRRQRPSEADPALEVLFDYDVAFVPAGPAKGDITLGAKTPGKGTPRHPAYPSGHSTYSAAASTVLGCLIGAYNPRLAGAFAKLAVNIGEARLWGGVHWPSDHDAGQLIGNAVGQLVIEHLNRTGIVPKPKAVPAPPPYAALEGDADAFAKACGTGTGDFCAFLFPAFPFPPVHPGGPVPDLRVLPPQAIEEIGVQNPRG